MVAVGGPREREDAATQVLADLPAPSAVVLDLPDPGCFDRGRLDAGDGKSPAGGPGAVRRRAEAAASVVPGEVLTDLGQARLAHAAAGPSVLAQPLAGAADERPGLEARAVEAFDVVDGCLDGCLAGCFAATAWGVAEARAPARDGPEDHRRSPDVHDLDLCADAAGTTRRLERDDRLDAVCRVVLGDPEPGAHGVALVDMLDVPEGAPDLRVVEPIGCRLVPGSDRDDLHEGDDVGHGDVPTARPDAADTDGRGVVPCEFDRKGFVSPVQCVHRGIPHRRGGVGLRRSGTGSISMISVSRIRKSNLKPLSDPPFPHSHAEEVRSAHLTRNLLWCLLKSVS